MLEFTSDGSAVIILGMSRMPLSDFARTIAMRLPQTPCRCRVEKVREEHFIFSAENLPEVPPLLVTSDLVMKKTEHHYGSNCPIPSIPFYPSAHPHRPLPPRTLAPPSP